MAVVIVGTLLACAPARVWLSPQIGGAMEFTGSTGVKSAGPGLYLRAPQSITQEGSLGAGRAGHSRPGGVGDRDLPTPSRSANYTMSGAGLHMPIGNDAFSTGPTGHLVIGRIWALGESTLVVEGVPTLWVRKMKAEFTLPLRGRIIV